MLQTHLGDIKSRYCRSTFVLDVVASLPLDLFMVHTLRLLAINNGVACAACLTIVCIVYVHSNHTAGAWHWHTCGASVATSAAVVPWQPVVQRHQRVLVSVEHAAAAAHDRHSGHCVPDWYLLLLGHCPGTRVTTRQRFTSHSLV